MSKREIVDRAIRKAMQSRCTYKVSALGFNRKGELIYSSFNKSRFMRKSGGIHAEMNVMLSAGPALRTIILCRVGREGSLLPIEPCLTCAQKAKELGIKIYSLKP